MSVLPGGLTQTIKQAPEAGARIGASRYEYTARRNGTHPKTVATPAGQLDLAVFKLRQGSFFPSLVDRFGFCGGCVVTPRPQVADDLGQGAPPLPRTTLLQDTQDEARAHPRLDVNPPPRPRVNPEPH